MPEFKIKCYCKWNTKEKIWNDKEPQKTAVFWWLIFEIYPLNILLPQEGICLIWISDWLLKDINANFKENKDYQFVVKLGEPNTANFKHKVHIKSGKNWDNNMILKNKEYFQNTVQKIGRWGSKDYFYEVDKKENSPPKPTRSNLNQPNNKNIWVKITLICLLFLIPVLLILGLIKWISKRKN